MYIGSSDEKSPFGWFDETLRTVMYQSLQTSLWCFKLDLTFVLLEMAIKNICSITRKCSPDTRRICEALGNIVRLYTFQESSFFQVIFI